MRTSQLERYKIVVRLADLGINRIDANHLRSISMTLQRWFDMECGTDNGCIERDEESNLPYWLNSHTMKRSRIADRETGALKRLAVIMAAYPELVHYVQGDCRGASLYILRKSDVWGKNIDQVYNLGIAVY